MIRKLVMPVPVVYPPLGMRHGARVKVLIGSSREEAEWVYGTVIKPRSQWVLLEDYPSKGENDCIADETWPIFEWEEVDQSPKTDLLQQVPDGER
jgi:hypothetical protein